MTRSDWIAIVAIIIASLFSSIQVVLQLLGMRATSNLAVNPPKQQANQTKNKRRLPYRWKVRLLIFLVNTVATYFLIQEVRDPNPLSRISVLIIAAEVGVMVICFILPLFLGVYESIENSS